MSVASGVITAVQEQRFRLLTDSGRTFLLTLSNRASLRGTDLCRLQQANTHVVVEFTGSPNLAGAAAHRIVASGSTAAPGPF